MNISYNWLKEYVDFDLTPDEVAAALTSIGLETGGVEEVQTIKGGLEGLVVGEVLTCEPHPNSDHMHITTVNLGQGEPVQIVCGAANVAAGQKVIVATLGTKLYDGDECFTIKKSKLRGVESNGMICAEDEIGVGTSHEGIIVLPADVVPGTLAKDYYNVKSEYVLEVDITPNRADACSHYGVARDLYAWLIQNGHKATLKRPSVDAFKVDNHDMNIDIVVENTEACPRYAGVAIKGVTVKESPEWLQNKLRLIGVRPINNIVDITNYILHAYGQPMHCFDADKIKGGKIVVKTCAEGTPFVTLDEVERKLSDKDLMICNAEEPMCIAGVFGGLDSGTTETTTDVFLESAYFHPTWVRKTARRHGLSTDSSFRFERGIDPNITIYALKEAALLVKELAGGEIASDIKDNFSDTLVNNYVRDGKNYAVPKDFDTNALWYNKDLFDQAGVEYPTDDMTYDDLVALATELKDKLPDGVYPFACPVDFQTWYYQTVYANGGWILNDDATETGYGDAKTQEGIQCWIDMIDAGLSPSASTLSETGSDAMFEGEQIAMTLAGSYMVPEYASNDTIKDKIDCVEVPTFNGVEDNCINGLGFAVYEGSKQKEEAEKFAIWMGSSEAQKIQGETGVVISARSDAQQYFAKANEQYNLAAYTNHSDEAYPLPVCSKAAELYDMESTWLTKAYTGEMSLADACSGLKEEADALLAK